MFLKTEVEFEMHEVISIHSLNYNSITETLFKKVVHEHMNSPRTNSKYKYMLHATLDY